LKNILKKRILIGNILCAGVLALPVQDLSKWNQEAFSKKKSNQFAVENGALLVSVKKSASPLFFQLTEKKNIKGFKVVGEFRGLPQFKDPLLQGTKGSDDYPFRLGLVVPGTKTLSGIYKFVAAKWVQRIYSLLPKAAGLDRIEFFNVSQNNKELGLRRTHYSSDLIKESIVQIQNTPGPFTLEHTFPQPIEALAIWISIDGDDTQSEFDVLLSSIQIFE
jgi:hypothetical protein